MSIEWVNGAIEEIRAWGRTAGVEVDVEEVRLLCDYASDYLDVGELADFTPGTFERLLLDIYPRKVIAPPESAPQTVAAARTLVGFLLDSGETGTKTAARMLARLDEIAPEMPAALADTTRFGRTKTMFGAMGADALENGVPYTSADDLAATPSRRAGGGPARPPHPAGGAPFSHAPPDGLAGLAAPEDPAEGDAAGLIEVLLSGVPTERAERDIASWLALRGPQEAARELLGAVTGATAARRGVAVAVLDGLGPEAAPAVRSYLEDRELRPHAVRWLVTHRLTAPALTSREALWVKVDLLAFTLPVPGDDPGDLAGDLAVSGPPAHVLEQMWRVDHPDVAEVLDLLGRHLPDEDLAKTARKAAFKARSRDIR